MGDHRVLFVFPEASDIDRVLQPGLSIDILWHYKEWKEVTQSDP